MKNIRYGVVIVTYNRLELLKECIANVLQQSKAFSKIVIIDNCSTDGTCLYLDSNFSANPNMKIIRTETNIGGAGGFALGVESVYKDVDYVLLIDDDAMLENTYIEKIDANIEDNILAYSGTVITDGVIDTSHRRILKSKISMRKQDVGLEYYEKNSFDYDLASFCGLIVSSALIKLIGLPKKEYFIWYDDTEYSMRISKYTKIRNINVAILNHKTKNNTTSRLDWRSFYGYRNSIDMCRTHSSNPFVYIYIRYVYFAYRSIYYRIRSFFGDKEYNSYISTMFYDLIKESLAQNLGINKKYHPTLKK